MFFKRCWCADKIRKEFEIIIHTFFSLSAMTHSPGLLCLLLVLVVGCVSAETYYVSLSFGSDANDGSYDMPWRTLGHVNDRLMQTPCFFEPGDRVLFCRGDTYHQAGLVIQAGYVIGNETYPVSMSAYDCRNTTVSGSLDTVQYPNPVWSTSSLLPQSSDDVRSQWVPVTWMTPSGQSVPVLGYDLSGLADLTGTMFIPNLTHVTGGETPQISGLWIGGERYNVARIPDLLDNQDLSQARVEASFYLDTTWNTNRNVARSNSTDLFVSHGSWCTHIWHELFGEDDDAYSRGLPTLVDEGHARIRAKILDYIIDEFPLTTWTPSTINCTLFMQELLAPNNFTTWDNRFIDTIALPTSYYNDTAWQPTRLFNVGGDDSAQVNWFSGPSPFWQGWTNGFYLDNHAMLLNAPCEYWHNETSGWLYVVPCSEAVASQMLTTYSTTVIPLAQDAFANAAVDYGYTNATTTTILFNSEAQNMAIIGYIGNSGGYMLQSLEFSELTLAFSQGGVFVYHYWYLAVHHCYFHYLLGGGAITGSQPSTTYRYDVRIFDNIIDDVEGPAIQLSNPTTIVIVNNTIRNQGMRWETAGNYALISQASQYNLIWGNTFLDIGYIGILADDNAFVQHNVLNRTCGILLDGGPIASGGGTIEYNEMYGVVDNTLNGIISSQSPLARGMYGASTNISFNYNIIVNSSGTCIFGGSATSRQVFTNNLCLNAGYQINPFPATVDLAMAYGIQYVNNSIFHLSPTLDVSVDRYQSPYKEPILPFLTATRSFIWASSPPYPLFSQQLLCNGLLNDASYYVSSNNKNYARSPDTSIQQYGNSYFLAALGVDQVNQHWINTSADASSRLVYGNDVCTALYNLEMNSIKVSSVQHFQDNLDRVWNDTLYGLPSYAEPNLWPRLPLYESIVISNSLPSSSSSTAAASDSSSSSGDSESSTLYGESSSSATSYESSSVGPSSSTTTTFASSSSEPSSSSAGGTSDSSATLDSSLSLSTASSSAVSASLGASSESSQYESSSSSMGATAVSSSLMDPSSSSTSMGVMIDSSSPSSYWNPTSDTLMVVSSTSSHSFDHWKPVFVGTTAVSPGRTNDAGEGVSPSTFLAVLILLTALYVWW